MDVMWKKTGQGHKVLWAIGDQLYFPILILLAAVQM